MGARFTLSRRALLRGAAGAAVALPPLEIMGQRKARGADAIPKRFLMSYGGVSLGSYGVPIEQSVVIPKTTGAAWEKTRGLAPIFDASYDNPDGTKVTGNMKAQVGLVSGLLIPYAPFPGPPGGICIEALFHGTTMKPQISGERVTGDASKNLIDWEPKGSSADQLVADAIKGNTPLPSVNVRAQASYYYGTNAANDSYSMSYRSGKSNTPMKSLRQGYNTLFSAGGVIDGRTYDVAAFIDRRMSILDAVKERSKRLLPRLGSEDRMRMDKYYTEIRALETSLEGIKMKSGSMQCKPGAEPTDPPIGDGYSSTMDDLSKLYGTGMAGWSNEELRAQILADYIHLAFSCDLTRSAIYHLTLAQSTMNAYHITPNKAATDLHGAGHGGAGGSLECMADIVAWHVKHFCRLAAKLRDTVEVDGSRVLDHCAMNMTWEGGHGDTGDPTRINDAHSTQNMMVVVAGGAGGLKSGQHVHFKNTRHPAQVILTHMNAVGYPEGQPLGEVTNPIPELFTLT